MSDTSLQVGDDVSWNWGGGQPTGKVKEVKTSGKLEIESKGKRVHKNADEDNPAVHVERDGNDVVKRASELNRLRGGGENGAVGEAEHGEGEEVTAEEPKKKTGRRPRRGGKQATGETKKQAEGAKKGGTRSRKAAAEKKKAEAEKVAVGEKREREEEAEEGEEVRKEGEMGENVDGQGVGAEQENAEKEAGKEVKKAKIASETTKDQGQITEGTLPPTEESTIHSELAELEADNAALGLDVGATTSKPRTAAEAAKKAVAEITSEADAEADQEL